MSHEGLKPERGLLWLFCWSAPEDVHDDKEEVLAMKRLSLLAAVAFVISLAVGISQAFAHFQMIIPSQNIVTQNGKRTVQLDIRFTHPFEGQMMNMEKPDEFGVFFRGKKYDLLKTLQPTTIKGKQAWKTSYTFKRPGDYIFYVCPKPYWEPAEDKFIIHYTKTVVDAYGFEEGWDQEIGLKTEIIPLVRPYGIYTGEVFRGVVKLDGKPVPYAEIEVEWYNAKNEYKAPSPPYVTQVIKADKNGVFSFAMPKQGWWGFAALSDGGKILKYKGEPKDVELGAIFWVYVHDMVKK